MIVFIGLSCVHPSIGGIIFYREKSILSWNNLLWLALILIAIIVKLSGNNIILDEDNKGNTNRR